jgi:penicillin-insensitive murein DD-endopeptidase
VNSRFSNVCQVGLVLAAVSLLLSGAIAEIAYPAEVESETVLKRHPASEIVPLPVPRPDEPAATPASQLFSVVTSPNQSPSRAIGTYSRGCLSGASSIPLVGQHWQVMRVSRNRYWGHPKLIGFIERLANKMAAEAGWPGILIGDMSQPRGGPMPSGHASHQIGLDADIWFRPRPERPFSAAETETTEMTRVVAPDGVRLESRSWISSDVALIRLAAQDRDVERVFVSPVIKKELCRVTTPVDLAWMQKVRPWYAHRGHMHVRLSCPLGSPECRAQRSVRPEDGCGKALKDWFSPRMRELDNTITTRAPIHRNHPLLDELPKACASVLMATQPARSARSR